MSPAPSAVAPPSPGGRLPLVGHALRLHRRPLEFFDSLRECGGLALVRIGPKPVYVVGDGAIAHEVLVARGGAFSRSGFFAKAARWLPDPLVTGDGERHRRRRALLLPVFGSRFAPRWSVVVSEVAASAASDWHDGAILDVRQELARIGVMNVARTFFSTELDARTAASFQRSLAVLTDGIERYAADPTGVWEKLPTAGNRRFAEAIAHLRRITDRVVATPVGGPRADLIGHLPPLPGPELHAAVMGILVAGTETVSTTLAWAFHLLGEHPDVERRLHAEVDAVLGGGAATHAELSALRYTRRVVTETLRVRPPVWLIPRRADVDVALAGHEIPCGSDVLVSPYLVHHRPEPFPDPDRFDPDRWLPERSEAVDRRSFMPFGAGVHACLGTRFAWSEAIIVLATIAGRWRLRPLPGRHVTAAAAVTLRPGALRMTAVRR